MRRWLAPFILVLMVLPGLGCAKLRNKPVKAVPEGTVLFAFNRKVRGPVELTLDGVRVPVAPVTKNKAARSLVVTGIAPGASAGQLIVVPQRSTLVEPRLRLPRR